VTIAKKLSIAAVLCGALIASAIPAAGDGGTVLLDGIKNAAMPGACVIEVPGMGLTFNVDVLDTRYLISLDEETGTVQYLQWSQVLDELMVPVPPAGASTGRFTVIPGVPISGSTDPATGVVTSTGTWAAYFDDTATIPVGIFSPFIVDNTMEATLTWDTATTGRGAFAWFGESFDPVSGLTFSFNCEANTLFTVAPHHTHDKGSGDRHTGPDTYGE